jgi:hypothetical protein
MTALGGYEAAESRTSKFTIYVPHYGMFLWENWLQLPFRIAVLSKSLHRSDLGGKHRIDIGHIVAQLVIIILKSAMTADRRDTAVGQRKRVRRPRITRSSTERPWYQFMVVSDGRPGRAGPLRRRPARDRSPGVTGLRRWPAGDRNGCAPGDARLGPLVVGHTGRPYPRPVCAQAGRSLAAQRCGDCARNQYDTRWPAT